MKTIPKSSLLIEVVKDPERKSLFKITTELIYLSFIFRTIPTHYFSRFLFKKDRINIRNYFPGKFLYQIKQRFNDKKVREVLENKLYFDFFYRQFNINLPEILLYNHGKMFVVDKKCIEVKDPEEFKKLLLWVAKDKEVEDAFFVKQTYWSYGGAKTHKLFIDQISAEPDLVTNIYNEVIKTGYLFQRTIKQHPIMNGLNPSCVNTLRIDAFTDSEGKVEIMSGYLRTSIRNMHVDNISSGGCSITIFLESGKLDKYAYLDINNGGVERLLVHPVTQTVFENFTIPYIEEAKKLVLDVAHYMPRLRLVGWDVAIGENGPILVEGNSDYEITGNDHHYGGYLTHPVFRKALKEIDYL